MKKPTISKLKKRADAIFSQYIRQKHAKNGQLKCYTCDKVMEIKEAQNGHYIPRRHLATRYLEENCRPQCYRCNCILKGNYDEYSLRLMREKGADILEILNSQKNTLKPMKIADYEELIFFYKNKLDMLK